MERYKYLILSLPVVALDILMSIFHNAKPFFFFYGAFLGYFLSFFLFFLYDNILDNYIKYNNYKKNNEEFMDYVKKEADKIYKYMWANSPEFRKNCQERMKDDNK